jgi:hypothetical protein
MRVKLFLIFLVYLAGSATALDKVYVFYPSVARPQAVQEKLQNSLQGVEVTVFGRYNDFTTKMEIEPAQMIITKPALIQQLSGYEIKLKGARAGKTEESYVLLSINKGVDLETLTPETVIGIIDIFGRNGMNKFAGEFFTVIPKLKRVTKVEDLLPLLTFNMATAILIQEPAIQYFKSTSNLNFVITKLPDSKDGIVALAVKSGGNADKIITVLKSADKELCSFFEVDLWK